MKGGTCWLCFNIKDAGYKYCVSCANKVIDVMNKFHPEETHHVLQVVMRECDKELKNGL